MALDTPTTKEIAANIVANLQASLSQTIPTLAKAFIRVLAKTLGAIYVILYKYLGYIHLQQYISSCSFSETEINGRTLTPLIEWGRQLGVGDPVAATQAELIVDVTVINETGLLASGAQLRNPATGVIYITIGSVNLDAPTVQATIRAVNDQTGTGGVGSQGNMENGETLQFVNPLPSVDRTVVVSGTVTTAADAETEEAYRQRVLDRSQKRPQGGAYADYEQWAEEVPGIINAYPYTGNPGEVNVYSEATVESSGNPDGIPTNAQLQDVYDSITQADRAPVGAFVNSLPISRAGFSVDVQGLLVDDPASVQADIEAAVTEYFLEREPFIEGLSIPPRKDRVTVAGISGVVDDIVQLTGGVFEIVLVFDSVGAAVGTYALQEGQKAKLESISFT